MSIVQDNILDSIRELQRLADLFAQRREQLARSVGLSVQQWHVMEEISDEHFMPSMFAKSRESSAAAVSKILRQLNDKKLIEVAVDDNDGRIRRYTLSEEGRSIMERLRQNRELAIEAVWAKLDPDELNQFQHFAAVLSDRLENYANRDIADLEKSHQEKLLANQEAN